MREKTSAAVARESLKDVTRNSQARDSTVPKLNEDETTRRLEETEGRIKENVSRKFGGADIPGTYRNFIR